MQTDTVLTDIATMAASLVAQKTLRSKAVLLQRLMPLIDQAMQLGHKHEAIHSAIEGAGVELTFGYYRNTLHRLRARIASGAASPQTPKSDRASGVIGSKEPIEKGLQEPNPVGSQEPEPPELEPKPVSTGGVFEVHDALKRAQAVSQVDYRKLARNKGKS